MPVEFRAVKLTNVASQLLFSDQSIAEGMDYLASIGINTVLTVVWNSSGADGDYTLYPSEVMDEYFNRPIHPAFNNRDPLQRVIIEAHRNGMEVLPWFEMGFSTSYSQDGGYILQLNPDWALLDRNGNLVVKNGFDWMSAIHPDVQDFILALTVEVVDKYDVDGIEYSDRIPAMPVEGGYEYETVELYKSEHGGNEPPQDHNDAAWKRWRADKLSRFFRTVRDSVKARGEYLTVSSSPSLYPWAYDNYLQDSKTWVESGISDDIIPQVYRYSYSDYAFELNKSLSNFPDHRHVYFAGMLIKVGDYLITPKFLLDAIALNRQNNVMGEAFFFYEGLRANNNQLGDTLRATHYRLDALVPLRNGQIWRPKATIVNEDDPGALITGTWKTSTIQGFKPNILLKDDPEYAAIEYYFDVPFDAWFDVFAYIVTGPLATTQAHYTVYSDADSFTVVMDQTNTYKAGWQPLQSVYLTRGTKKILKLDNRNLVSGQKLSADAAMIMINRKRSPDVLVSIPEDKQDQLADPKSFRLSQNYPNPFNPVTTIRYAIGAHHDAPVWIDLSIYNLLGQKVATLISAKQPAGHYEVQWDASGMASGVYLYKLSTDQGFSQTRKLVLLR